MEIRNLKILAIDDNPDNLTTLKAVIRDALPGSRLLTALSGPTGIEVARAEDPDVILLDIIMPDMDGFAVCRKLKEDEELRLIPVIFLTAIKTDRESRLKALEVGAEVFLSKPFDEVELTAQIHAMSKIKAANRRQQNEAEKLADLVSKRTQELEKSQTALLSLMSDLKDENEARKKSEEALRISEQDLREAQAIAHTGSWKWDVKKAEVTWSDEAYRIFGLDKSAIHGPLEEAITKVIHPDDLHMILPSSAETFTNEPVEYRIILPDASIRYIWSKTGHTIFGDDGKPIFLSGIVQDITERKQAEAALKQSEQKYSALFEKSAIPSVLTKLPEGIFVEVNNAFETIYGYSRQDIRGKTSLEIGMARPDERTHTYNTLDQQGTVTDNYKHIFTKAGEPRVALINVSKVTIDGDQFAITTIHDVTERVRAEKARQESEARFRSALDNMLEGCQIISHDWVYLYINAAAEHQNRRPGKELLGRKFLDVWPGIEEHGIYGALKRCMEQRTSEQIDIEFVFPGGERGWFSVSVHPVPEGVFILTIETTEQERAAKAEQENRAKLDVALQSMTDAVFISDIEGNFIEFNDAFATFHKFKNKEECFKTLSEYPTVVDVFLANGDPAPLDQWAVPRALRGETGSNVEYSLRRKDTGETWVGSYSFAPIRDKDGTIIGSVVVSRDITERKQAEEALRQSEATVRNKLKAITDPEGDIDTLELSDIIDTNLLQSILEDFYHLTGMLGAVLDVSGKVLVAVGWQDICTKFHRCNPETLKNCVESDTILTHGVPEGTFKAYRCKNNLWDIVTPLIVGGRHVGNVFIGQFFHQDDVLDVDLFRAQARKYGFDETEYLAALDRVPRFSKEAIEAGMQFYAKLAGIISTLSFSTIQQSRMLFERKRTEELLQQTEETYRTLAENSPDLIARFDQHLRHIYVNRSAAAIGVFSPQDYIGKTLEEMGVPEPNRSFWNQLFQKVFDTGEPLVIERDFLTSHGLRTYNTKLIAEFASDGSVQSVLSLARDITERKRAEIQVNEQLDELRRWYNATLGREERILELKSEVNELLSQTGQPPRYLSTNQNQ